jgi:hypothetical protein
MTRFRNLSWLGSVLRVALFTAVGLAAVFAAAPVSGQRPDGSASAGAHDPRGVVAGRVRDALTGVAVRGATVVLQPETAGAFPGAPAGSSFAVAARTVATDPAGAYRFADLAPGVYRLYASALGYRPFSALVEVRSGAAAVSLGLDAEPVSLHPIRARGQARGPYEAANAYADQGDLARLMAADQRRRRFLTSDVRELTHADVVEAVTLGEPDVFRALQRLPGVTTRSEYTAEIWTRGAPWSHTRVYFDGVPVFNPLHALGMLSGVPSSALGAAWFHPGTRSAGMGEGAAGVVDLQSRRAAGGGELNAQADLSLMSAGLALDQRVLDGRAGWMLTGRRSYLDWLSELAGRAAGRDDAAFPYRFSELAGRVDAWTGDATLLEASWLWEADELQGESFQNVESLVARWGNALGRVTVSHRAQGLHFRGNVAGSSHHGWVGQSDQDLIPSSELVRRLSEGRAQYAGVTGSVSPEPASLAGPPWSRGIRPGASRCRVLRAPDPPRAPAQCLDHAGGIGPRGRGCGPRVVERAPGGGVAVGGATLEPG